jgi:hypothetical protein
MKVKIGQPDNKCVATSVSCCVWRQWRATTGATV